MSLSTADYQAVQRGMTVMFRQAAAEATPFYPELCTVIPSKYADENYAWLGSMPGVREWIGPRQFKQLRAANYILPNKHWESSVEIEKTTIDDDRMGMLRPKLGDLADEAMYHPDELLFEKVVNLGESQPCFDGQYFFDTDHVWGDSGSQSNDLTYAAASGTTPTSGEFRAAFHQALIALLGFKNDQGKFLIRPKIGKLGKLMVAVPLALYEVAVKAFEQTIVLEDSVGLTNFTLEKPTVVVIQYMGAGATNGSDIKFDLYYTGGRLKPYVFQAREPLKFQTKGFNDIEFKVIKAMTEARYNIGFLAWWTAVRTTFT